MTSPSPPAAQSAGWIVQTYISFAVSMSAPRASASPTCRSTPGCGPSWPSPASTRSPRRSACPRPCATSTSRRSVVARVDEAKLERLLTEHDPFKARALTRSAPASPPECTSGAGLDRAMRVEIWSDVVCPWCYVGTRRFERGRRTPRRTAAGDSRWCTGRSSSTPPSRPRAWTWPATWAASSAAPTACDQVHDRLDHAGADVDVDFRWEGKRRVNTFDAHRLDRVGARRRRRPTSRTPCTSACSGPTSPTTSTSPTTACWPGWPARSGSTSTLAAEVAGHGRVRRRPCGPRSGRRASWTSTRCRRS